MIVSHEAFIWFCTFMTAGISLGWGVRDVYLLAVHVPRSPKTARDRDQVFGSLVGLAIESIGVIGVLRFHL